MRERVAAGLIVIALLAAWLWSDLSARNVRNTSTPVVQAKVCSAPTVKRAAQRYVDEALDKARSKEEGGYGCSTLASMFVSDIHYSDFEEKQDGCELDIIKADPGPAAHAYLYSQRPTIEKLCPTLYADIDRLALEKRGTRTLMSMSPEERAAVNDAWQGR